MSADKSEPEKSHPTIRFHIGKIIRLIIVLIISIIGFRIWLYATPHHIWIPAVFKVVDPSKPGFDRSKFRFEDYITREQIKDVLVEIFPPGTRETVLDEVFVNSLHLQKTAPYPAKEPGSYFIYYKEPFNLKGIITGRYIWVWFHSNGTVKKLIDFNYTDFKGVGNPPGLGMTSEEKVHD